METFSFNSNASSFIDVKADNKQSLPRYYVKQTIRADSFLGNIRPTRKYIFCHLNRYFADNKWNSYWSHRQVRKSLRVSLLALFFLLKCYRYQRFEIINHFYTLENCQRLKGSIRIIYSKNYFFYPPRWIYIYTRLQRYRHSIRGCDRIFAK